MKTNFTFILPDEPYKNTTALNQQVNAVYEGPKYHLARIETATNIVHNIVRSAETVEDLNFDQYVEEGHYFLVIDAAENPFEVAYLTSSYTHDLIEDPTFVLPRGLGEWTYHYDDYKGGITQCFYRETLKYNASTKTFSGPDYRLHQNSREETFKTLKIQAEGIRKSLRDNANDYTAEDKKTLEDHATWLENVETTFHDVDHWKIPFPAVLPRLL